MPKIVFVGAGVRYSLRIFLTDILSLPDLSHSEIMLYDIDDDRLRTTARWLTAFKHNSILKRLSKVHWTSERLLPQLIMSSPCSK
ncbi:MAG: hypothetical protein Ct9H90mP5_09220 [Acidimicrobiaceae bacterium]|nr:MAG: hypothetical protein Ct9H90mP5_09220 [Acidimicrobiaceae bacterium]